MSHIINYSSGENKWQNGEWLEQWHILNVLKRKIYEVIFYRVLEACAPCSKTNVSHHQLL